MNLGKSKDLYSEFIKLLLEVNDETKDEKTHRRLEVELWAWRCGVSNATGIFLNGDYYYIKKGIDRPMCCGEFLDWKYTKMKGGE